MNWDAIGAIGEVLGATAVVVTIFYLAIQTRRATQANLARTFQDHFRAVSEHFNEMWSATNAELMIKGLQSFTALTPSERARFDNLVTNAFNLFETSIVHNRQGLLDQASMENWSWYMRNHLLGYPGVREWWPLKKQLYPPEVRDWIDSEMEAAQTAGDFYGILE